MQPRRIVVAAALGLPAAVTALALVETASLHFKDRDHTLHFGDPRFGIIGHLPIGQPRRYVDGCRSCDADRLAAGHWTRSYAYNTEPSQPGHVDPVDGCVHCQDRTSPDPGTALAGLDEQEQQWLRDVRSRMGLRARAGEVVLDGLDAVFDATLGPLCDGLEALLWRWFPAAPQPSCDAA
jgi:hypothetical protein